MQGSARAIQMVESAVTSGTRQLMAMMQHAVPQMCAKRHQTTVLLYCPLHLDTRYLKCMPSGVERLYRCIVRCTLCPPWESPWAQSALIRTADQLMFVLQARL